jgi:hypothetical protein
MRSVGSPYGYCYVEQPGGQTRTPAALHGSILLHAEGL